MEPSMVDPTHAALRCLALTTFAAACLLACACEPSPPTTTTTTAPAVVTPPHGRYGEISHTYTGTGPTVAILGDSLTVLGWDALYGDLDTDHAVKIGAWYGEGFDGGSFSDTVGQGPLMPSVAAEYAANQPDVVVIALGTNTVWGAGDLTAALTNEATAVSAFGDACLVWVTVPADPGASDWDAVGAQQLDAAATWADETVDWAGAVAADPTLLTAGHVHTTAAGTAQRAQMIADAVRSCP
jgi:lysophospholipase L1-like esterase